MAAWAGSSLSIPARQQAALPSGKMERRCPRICHMVAAAAAVEMPVSLRMQWQGATVATTVVVVAVVVPAQVSRPAQVAMAHPESWL